MITDKVQKYTKPFEHLVIDDFFTSDILLRISNLPDNNKRIQRIEDPDIFNYFEDNVGIDFVKQHLTYTRKDPAGNSYAEITRCSDPYMYGIHDEHHKKKVSTVVYLEPQYASGTFLYNEKKQLVKQVAWKPNRAFIFSGIPDVTWHDYGHWEPEPRVSVNYFIK
jgi:hypothetical protein|tara:strand:- start:130 stop:624 length:495 start_codon:yes stop_codon:yes gene_type:complete